jgi:hypothetical protein
MIDIRVCDEGGENNDIVVCEEEKNSDIIVCEEEEKENCTIATAPSIDDPAANSSVSEGTVINISGGVQPYSVFASQVTLTKNSDTQWEFGTMPTCASPGDSATSTITVTDACGRIDTKVVLLSLTGARWCCDNPTAGNDGCGISHIDVLNDECYPDEGLPSGTTYEPCVPSISGTQYYILDGVGVKEQWRCVWELSVGGLTPPTPLDGSDTCEGRSCGGHDAWTLATGRSFAYWRCT